MIEHSMRQIQECLPFVDELAIGATAVGTGINCPKDFDEKICAILKEKTGIDLSRIPINFML